MKATWSFQTLGNHVPSDTVLTMVYNIWIYWIRLVSSHTIKHSTT